jgi:excisionase family DNA binding protein
METFLTPEQVASQLSVETTTVYTWLRNSRLSGVKFGRLWRVRATDVEMFMQKGWRRDTVQQQSADISWIDKLPQIDLRSVYAPNTIFSREDIYHDDEAEQQLYSTTVASVQHTKGRK